MKLHYHFINQWKFEKNNYHRAIISIGKVSRDRYHIILLGFGICIINLDYEDKEVKR